jgi:hypothetical protein
MPARLNLSRCVPATGVATADVGHRASRGCMCRAVRHHERSPRVGQLELTPFWRLICPAVRPVRWSVKQKGLEKLRCLAPEEIALPRGTDPEERAREEPRGTAAPSLSQFGEAARSGWAPSCGCRVGASAQCGSESMMLA